jgi:hypothetical protein
MKRRTFLVGFGGLTAATSFTLGTDSFTSVSAYRRLTVETTNDNYALLALKQLGDGKRSVEDGTPELVGFSCPGLEERRADPELGLGTDSVYEFDQDANEANRSDPTEGLLRIINQGTQPVSVYSRHDTSSEIDIELYDVSDPDRTALRDDPPRLSVGDSLDVGFRIRTFGADVGEFDETLSIVAEA